jgi:hypothetical protein
MAYITCQCDSCGLVELCLVVRGEFDEQSALCSACIDDIQDGADMDMDDEDDIDPPFDYDDSMDEIGYDPYAGAYENEVDFGLFDDF